MHPRCRKGCGTISDFESANSKVLRPVQGVQNAVFVEGVGAMHIDDGMWKCMSWEGLEKQLPQVSEIVSRYSI